MKNPQFLADQAETLAILPIHDLVIFTKFHINWTKIVDFSLIACFSANAIFYYSVSSKLMAYDEFVSFLCYKQIDFNVWKVRIVQKKKGLHYMY